MDYKKYLKLAEEEANIAFSNGDYPIGAVLIDESGNILAKCHNQNKTLDDISAHAEILCLRNAGIKLTTKDLLTKTYLFTSLEPCFGCSFFIDRTNISKIIWSLTDPHKGGISKLKDNSLFKDFFEKLELIAEPDELLKDNSKKLMQDYFINLGKPNKAQYYI